MTAHLIYGSALQEFITLYRSMSEMTSFIAGDYDYSVLEQASPWFTIPFYYGWLILIYFIIMNLTIAILTDGYRLAKEDTGKDAWQHDMSWLLFDVWKRFVVSHYRLRLWYLNSRYFSIYIYAFCCTNCCKKIETNERRESQDQRRRRYRRQISRSRRSRRRSIFNATATDIRRDLNLSNRELMIKDWDSELQFLDLMLVAARKTKTTKNLFGAESLYDYFRQAHAEDIINPNSCIAVGELCALLRDAGNHNCKHDRESCLAAQIIQAYQQYRSSFLIGSYTREEFSGADMQALNSDSSFKHKFVVKKIIGMEYPKAC